jgi:hypothetical protein
MAETLLEKACTPCRGGIPPLAREQAERYRGQVRGWELLDDARWIRRTYRFGTSARRSPSCEAWASSPKRKHSLGGTLRAG